MAPDASSTSVRELGRALRKGRATAAALALQVIDRQRRSEPVLNAYRSFDADLLRRQAEAADRLFAAGYELGPFQGLPVSVKDLFGLAGFRTFAGTPRALPREFEREGPLVAAFRRQAALLAGKSHTVEFAFGGLGTNRHHGAPRNPWDPVHHRVSGGSSSGAGVSLQQGTAVIAIGSDTTGSIRMPASWTGTVGLKLGRGRWSCAGIVGQSETLDTPGLLARTVEDLAIGFATVEGATGSADEILRPFQGRDLVGARLGVPRQLFFQECGPGIAEAVRAAMAELERAGARLVDFDLPEAVPAFELWQAGHLSAPEAYATLMAHFRDWLPTLDPDVRTRIETFGAMTAAEYLGRRRRILAWMDEVNARVGALDAILTPTIAITAPRLDEVADLDGYRLHNVRGSRNAAVSSLFDLCAVTLPVGLDAAGIPVGLQVAAARGSEPRLISLALAMERTLGTSRQRLGKPPLAPD